jgi:hypothetical protein
MTIIRNGSLAATKGPEHYFVANALIKRTGMRSDS